MTDLFREVYKGIDSLYISNRGTRKEGLKDELEMRKEYAQSDDERIQAHSTVTIDEHTFEVKDKGKGRYAYVLVDGWFHIQISGSNSTRLPAIYVQISSELLNCFGIYNALNQLRGITKELLLGTDTETLSRADLFVDFVTSTDFTKISKKLWITRAKEYQSHWTGDRFTGFSIGLGGDISARLYNKTIELEKSRKDYLKSIWERNGWDKVQDVWRLEFQLKRAVLQQMKINRVVDFVESLNDVWRYCTHDWLRLATEEKTQNRARWNTHPLWSEIKKVMFHAGGYTGITREISRSRQPNLKAMLLNSLGYLTDFAAYKGHDDLNEKVLLEYHKEAFDYLKEYTKGSSVYEGPKDYIQTKINLKKKKYNKPLEQK